MFKTYKGNVMACIIGVVLLVVSFPFVAAGLEIGGGTLAPEILVPPPTTQAPMPPPVIMPAPMPPPVIVPRDTPSSPPSIHQPTLPTLSIHSIEETPPHATRYVQLTVVTGIGANEVWVQFDGNRFRRGQEVVDLRTSNTKTWEITFRPNQWISQSVQVSANHAYVVTGAVTQSYMLTLSSPFVPPAEPRITRAHVANRNISYGGQATLEITTPQDINYVWVLDANNNRHYASRTRHTATTQIWTVHFRPGRSGSVAVYANFTRTTENAARRTEHITVGTRQHATIVSSTARRDWGTSGIHWIDSTITVHVTTNHAAERVWVVMPDGSSHTLTRQSGGSGTENRVWSLTFSDVNRSNSSLVLHVSEVDQHHSHVSRTLPIEWHDHWFGGHGFGWIWFQSGQDWIWDAQVQHWGAIDGTNRLVINTRSDVNSLWISHPWGTTQAQRVPGSTTQWTAVLPIWGWSAGLGHSITFHAESSTHGSLWAQGTWVSH